MPSTRVGAREWLRERHELPAVDMWQVLAEFKRLHLGTAGTVPLEPAEGSELAADDRAVSPYHLSHAISTALGIALDHLEAFRSLIEDGGRTHPWAHHTLLRATVENAATAVWLSAPPDPLERRFRRLRLAQHDAWESGQAAELHRQPSRSGRSAKEIRAAIRALAPDERDPLAGRLSYASIVRDAADGIEFDAGLLELVWRVESGLAHGRSWASIGMLNHEERPSGTAGVVHVRMEASLDSLAPQAALALRLIQSGRALYERRAQAASRIPGAADDV